jgi:type VI secretion system protein ImpJ
MSDLASDLRLALTRWEPGQILQPEHFRVQEAALLGSTIETARLAGLPFYGVGRLAWDEEALAKGTVLIHKLTVVFGPGQLVAVPENARLQSFDLKVPGATAALFLSLAGSSHRETEVGLDHDHAPRVAREIRHLKLSTTPVVDDSVALLKLATLEKKDGKWGLSSAHVPPLLQVGTSPFLTPLLGEMRALAQRLYADLQAKLGDDFFRGESMAVARRCQLGAYRLLTVLADLQHGVCRHPYFYLEVLRVFYLELCLLKNLPPEDRDPPTYDHDDLAASFNAVAARIKGRIHVPSVSSPSLPFAPDPGGAFVAAPFDDALIAAAEVYLVVQRPDLVKRVPFDAIKLASPSRLEAVHTKSLRGVRFARVDPSFQHSFGPGVDLYLLDRGDEWQHAVAERALSYYAPQSLEGIHVALFWKAA